MANHRWIEGSVVGASLCELGIAVIKRIELINFMSHRHTVIELDAGLTVLVGPNNCGKSAIVTALQILCHNDTSTYVMRHGAKECRIIVETQEGHHIEWIRKKSGSPSYLVNGKEFDRLKKESGVWEELKQTLRMPRLEFDNNNKFDVHIGEQRNPIFLLGDKGRGAAQFFAASSDAIRLVEMQALHKKQVAENKSERKYLIQEQTETNLGLENLESVPALSERLTEIESQYESLKLQQISAQQLEGTLEELKRMKLEVAQFLAIECALCELLPLPKFEDTQSLQQLTQQIGAAQQQIGQCKSLQAALETLAPPPTFADENAVVQLRDAIQNQRGHADRLAGQLQVLSKVSEPPQASKGEAVSKLAEFLVRYQAQIEEFTELEELRVASEGRLKKADQEIKAWASENPNCPTCGSLVSAEELIDGPGHRHGVQADA